MLHVCTNKIRTTPTKKKNSAALEKFITVFGS